MTNKAPLISIIIPCYNTEKYIAETLDSVLSQTLQDFEIIAVNDGSTDNTLAILEEYAKKHSQILVIDQENTYYIQARINGLKQASGKYLVFLDSDDKLEATYLEKCSNIAEENPNLEIVYSQAMFFGTKNKLWKLPKFNIQDFLLDNCIYCTALIRRSTYEKTNGFDTSLKMLEDWDLFISIIKSSGYDVVYRIEEPLFLYRLRQDLSSITNTATQEKISDSRLRIYIKHYDFYKKNGLFFPEAFNPARKKREKRRKNPLIKCFYRIFNYKRYKKYYMN